MEESLDWSYILLNAVMILVFACPVVYVIYKGFRDNRLDREASERRKAKIQAISADDFRELRQTFAEFERASVKSDGSVVTWSGKKSSVLLVTPYQGLTDMWQVLAETPNGAFFSVTYDLETGSNGELQLVARAMDELARKGVVLSLLESDAHAELARLQVKFSEA